MRILERLLSSEEPSVQKFSIYLPDKDKNQAQIPDLDDWADGAVQVLTEINGGSTKLPAADGSWKDNRGNILIDNTVVVYSFIRDPDAFEQRFEEIVAFVHEFGKGANQESVMIELSDGHRAYFIDEDDYMN